MLNWNRENKQASLLVASFLGLLALAIPLKSGARHITYQNVRLAWEPYPPAVEGVGLLLQGSVNQAGPWTTLYSLNRWATGAVINPYGWNYVRLGATNAAGSAWTLALGLPHLTVR